jgi:polyisoprenoid-binding protein YceI
VYARTGQYAENRQAGQKIFSALCRLAPPGDVLVANILFTHLLNEDLAMNLSFSLLHWAMLPLAFALSGILHAEEVHYTIDPTHTYPSFEADHFGISTWRGKMKKTTGTVTLDRAAHRGDVSITVDLDSIDFGMGDLNKWAVGKDFFDTAKNPSKATYVGHFAQFNGDVPTRVDGELTLHGVTNPLSLTLASFACKPHPMLKREWCGADAFATFQRDAFGLTAGKDYGFKMDVALRIQVEATRDEEKKAP